MSSDSSTNLALPFLMPSQAQKHVTHNEALGLLDLLVQLTVRDFGATIPPVLPEEGEVWALGAAPVGEWARQAGLLAAWSGGAWVFIEPRPGWRAAGLSDGSLRVWSGTGWERPGLDNLDGLGIGTAHDATNRLAVSSPATLLTHAGSDHRLLLNKAAVIDTASLLFQSGWSGRAEMGLAGDDDFAVKVSADGITWTEALRVTAATGAVTIPNGAQINGTLMGTVVTQSNADTTAGRLLKVGDFGLGGQALNVSDFNNAGQHNRMIFGTDSVTNAPFIWPAGWQFTRSDNRRVQFVLSSIVGIEKAAFRNEGSGGFGPWREFFHTGNLLGTVSQSGGVPTGAVIEGPTVNANGSFMRLANGLQICWRTAATTGGEVTWTYPAAFAASPDVLVSADATAARIATTKNRTATGIVVNSWNINGILLLWPIEFLLLADGSKE